MTVHYILFMNWINALFVKKHILDIRSYYEMYCIELSVSKYVLYPCNLTFDIIIQNCNAIDIKS